MNLKRSVLGHELLRQGGYLSKAESEKVDIRCRGMHTTADIASFLVEKEAA